LKRELIITADGSHTIYLPEMNEHFHSVNGAIAESHHIFIQGGLEPLLSDNNEIKILEMGFGTGLNAFLTCLTAKRIEVKISYDALETFPLEEDLWKKLNYPKLLGERKLFDRLHQAPWGQAVNIEKCFDLTKINDSIYAFQPANKKYKLVYFDAFAPSKQEEVWQESVFKKIFNTMQKDGILITYAASGKFRRNLKACGFLVESLEGPEGKREITRAIKK